jgi:hypothetical protein
LLQLVTGHQISKLWYYNTFLYYSLINTSDFEVEDAEEEYK